MSSQLLIFILLLFRTFTTLVESFDTCLDHSGSIYAKINLNLREFQKHEQKPKI